jgi:hypothetical protein
MPLTAMNSRPSGDEMLRAQGINGLGINYIDAGGGGGGSAQPDDGLFVPGTQPASGYYLPSGLTMPSQSAGGNPSFASANADIVQLPAEPLVAVNPASSAAPVGPLISQAPTPAASSGGVTSIINWLTGSQPTTQTAQPSGGYWLPNVFDTSSSQYGAGAGTQTAAKKQSAGGGISAKDVASVITAAGGAFPKIYGALHPPKTVQRMPVPIQRASKPWYMNPITWVVAGVGFFALGGAGLWYATKDEKASNPKRSRR